MEGDDFVLEGYFGAKANLITKLFEGSWIVIPQTLVHCSRTRGSNRFLQFMKNQSGNFGK